MSSESDYSSKLSRKGKARSKGDGKGLNEKPKNSDKLKKDVEDLHGNSVESTTHEHRKEKRKRRRDERDGVVAGAVVEDTVEKKKKKHKRTKGEDAADEGSREVVQPGSQKDKAESQEGSADVKDDNMEHGARHSPVQITLKKKKKSSDKETGRKPKKSHKKDNSASSFPDPHNDATLSDKGRAALSYAYTRFSTPDLWKFNKAHQIWIVKHFFSLDAIPTIYIPVAVKYLAGCQGGVRQNLIQACNAHLESSGPNQDSTTGESSTTPTDPDRPTPTDSKTNTNPLPPSNDGRSENLQGDIKHRASALLTALADGIPHS